MTGAGGIDELMRRAPVIPVLVIDEPDGAAEMAETFVAGGLPVLEVTMRTPRALDVIREMRGVPGAIVGAGTVLDVRQLERALGGAEFIVSPGLTDRLGEAALANDVPFLPGAATAGDLMRGRDLGFTHFKFFPAATSGGPAALRALSAPFADVRFCPTGGVTVDSAADWLALPSVLCVGGSWFNALGPEALFKAAREAASLRSAIDRVG